MLLPNALVNNNRLRDLDIRNNTDVTDQGWIILANAILRNPNSALERLDISGSHINSRITIAFADALMNNSRLKELYLGQSGSRMNSDGNEAFTHLLCNTSSIIETFQSNHTLTTLSIDEEDDEEQGFGLALSDDLTFLLRLNKENNANQAARIKIIQTHFSGTVMNVQPFMDMELSTRPHAIAWIARDSNCYRFLRAVPSLLQRE